MKQILNEPFYFAWPNIMGLLGIHKMQNESVHIYDLVSAGFIIQGYKKPPELNDIRRMDIVGIHKFVHDVAIEPHMLRYDINQEENITYKAYANQFLSTKHDPKTGEMVKFHDNMIEIVWPR